MVSEENLFSFLIGARIGLNAVQKNDFVSGSSKNVQNGPGTYLDSNLMGRWGFFRGGKTAGA